MSCYTLRHLAGIMEGVASWILFVVDPSNFSEDDKPQAIKAGGSRIIGRLLPAAIKVWLRSQVERVEQLSIDLAGRDRQIISGYLPSVSVSAEQVIYQGIHITQVQLSAKDIRMNIGQVVRGKPLRLLKAFPVQGLALLSSDDLNESLGSPMLAGGLDSFWRSLIHRPDIAESVRARYGSLPLQIDVMLSRPKIRLSEGCLCLSFYPATPIETAEQPVILGAALSIVSGHILQLNNARWLDQLDKLEQETAGVPVEALEGFQWDLGQDTELSQLELQASQLLCSGKIMVLP